MSRNRTLIMRTTTVFTGLLLVGCVTSCDSVGDEDDESSADALAAPSAAEAQACQASTVKTNALGQKIVLCTRPFADAPFVRLPADKPGTTTITFYAGVTLPSTFGGDFVLWTRDGKRFVPVDGRGEAIPFTEGSKLPKELRAPTNRVTFTLYQFKGTPRGAIDSPFGPATGIKLTSARPVVEIDGCAFDSRLAGTWDGTASERLLTPQGSGPFGTFNFDEAKRIPIRVKLGSLEARATGLAEFTGGEPIPDARTFLLRGVIENFDRDVVDGQNRFPSLKAMGEKNPFHGASDGKVELYRLGNMHGLENDGHWVLTYPSGSKNLTLNGMSFSLTAATAPSLFVDAKAEGTSELRDISIQPHVPFVNNGHVVVLSPKAIGAQTGTCPAP